jgi:hypothetical protein
VKGSAFHIVLLFFFLKEKEAKRIKKRAVLSLVSANKSLQERASPRS